MTVNVELEEMAKAQKQRQIETISAALLSLANTNKSITNFHRFQQRTRSRSFYVYTKHSTRIQRPM